MAVTASVPAAQSASTIQPSPGPRTSRIVSAAATTRLITSSAETSRIRSMPTKYHPGLKP